MAPRVPTPMVRSMAVQRALAPPVGPRAVQRQGPPSEPGAGHVGCRLGPSQIHSRDIGDWAAIGHRHKNTTASHPSRSTLGRRGPGWVSPHVRTRGGTAAHLRRRDVSARNTRRKCSPPHAVWRVDAIKGEVVTSKHMNLEEFC